MKINKNSKIFIAGHNGMVGSAIKKKLIEKGFKKIITLNKKKLNLIDQLKVFNLPRNMIFDKRFLNQNMFRTDQEIKFREKIL